MHFVGFFAWALALVLLREGIWFWLCLGLCFVWVGINWTIGRHRIALRQWLAKKMVQTGYAAAATAFDLAKAMSEGRIQRYRVRVANEWSKQWSVKDCKAASVWACRDRQTVETALMVEVDDPDGPRTHMMFPPFLTYRGEGQYLEFQADAVLSIGPEEDSDTEPVEACSVPT